MIGLIRCFRWYNSGMDILEVINYFFIRFKDKFIRWNIYLVLLSGLIIYC